VAAAAPARPQLVPHHRSRPRLARPGALAESSPATAPAAPAPLPPVDPAPLLLPQSPPAPPPPLRVVVRPARGPLELRQVARLRAEAYYASDTSRFAESFKRQFASQEADSLQHRTAPRAGRAPQCDCLVAVEGAAGVGPDGSGDGSGDGSSCSSSGGGGVVLGCIDIRVPQAATGLPASGVPAGEPSGAYILNVVVEESARGRGVGRSLMEAAMARAVRVWGAARLFTHVEADNDVASGLYRGCGFREHSDSAAYAGADTLGEGLGEAVGSCRGGRSLYWHGKKP
jgi:ribosomal protein S18 acetylase RimI-like enzyme